jgi:hypothetical protein
MRLEVYIDFERRPFVNIEADKVEVKDGYYNLYKGGKLVASFRQDRVVGYVEQEPPPEV